MTIFYSKKFWVSLAGLILAILAANCIAVPQDVKANILELIMVIVGAYDVGQGIADGVSGGKTSGVAVRAGTVTRLGHSSN